MLKESEGNRSMIYPDEYGHPTIGIAALLHQKKCFQDQTVALVAKESTDPALFKRVMDGFASLAIKFCVSTFLAAKVVLAWGAEVPADMLPLGAATSQVDHPRRTIQDNNLIEGRRADFLRHIRKAKSIELARSESAFSWTINWEKQRKFCTPVMNALFKQHERLQFPKPVFDSTVNSLRQLKKIFDPLGERNGCANIAEESLGMKPVAGDEDAPLGASFSPWGKKAYSLRIYSSVQGKNVFYIAEFLKPDANYAVDDPESVWGAIPNSPIMARGFYLPVANEEDKNKVPQFGSACEPRGAIESVGYPSSRSDKQDIVVVEIDGRLLVLEFGTYNDKLFEGYQTMFIIEAATARALWGETGQKYILVKDIEKSFIDSWAKSQPPERFLTSNQIMEQLSKDDTYYYACVINFDGLNR